MANIGSGRSGYGIMNKEQDEKNAAYVYSIHLLKMLLKMELISKQEFEQIVRISAGFYGIKK